MASRVMIDMRGMIEAAKVPGKLDLHLIVYRLIAFKNKFCSIGTRLRGVSK